MIFFSHCKPRRLLQEAQRTVEVQVEAELGDGRQQVWTHRLTLDTEQLLRRSIAEKWLAEHPGIPEGALAFDLFAKDSWMPLDTDNPEALGWDPSTPLRLLAYPTDERFIFQPALPSSPSPLPMAEAEAREADKSCSEEAKENESTERKVHREASPERQPAKKTPTKTKVKRVSKRPKEKAKPAAAPRSRSPRPAPEGPFPGDDLPVIFQQANPRKVGKDPWERYEKYKVARTLREARELGAFSGDLRWDWSKGYFELQ
ncbi:unnamed protein product [Symbiodinium sp. CCMP2592]|nr:unnamed protein product [Symbiodinium sp. CCMP2592]